ncbi:MAG: DoxX family protein [Trueperella sp.]|nr:DoxX family protein [Trueperella sp.]
MLNRLARPLLAAPFIASGIDALLRPAGHRATAKRVSDFLTELGLPALEPQAELITRISGGLMTAAGLALATSRTPRLAAFALALMQGPLALANNPFWDHDGDQRTKELNQLISALGLVGGAVIAASDRGGDPSLRWRMQTAAKNAADSASERAEELGII